MALILLVMAPAFGLFLDVVIMRGLEGTSEVIKTVVTVGVLFALIALAQIIWGPNVNRIVEPFFGAKSKIEIFGVSVLYHQLIVIGVADRRWPSACACCCSARAPAWRCVRWCRTARSCGSTVGDRAARLPRAGQLGSSLAALSGILIAYSVGSLAVLPLTLLVLNAYAAAIVGRLVSLPMTFVGAIILGLAQAYAVGYLPAEPELVAARHRPRRFAAHRDPRDHALRRVC